MNTILTWFARNRVAANLLLVMIVVGGLSSLGSIRKEVYQTVSLNSVSVSVTYLGATPEEVEKAVCTRIEDHLVGLESLKRIHSVATEGLCTVTIELLSGVGVSQALDEVRTRVESIETLPRHTERPIIRELIQREPVLTLVVSGQAEGRTLERLAEQLRADLSNLGGVSHVEVLAHRVDEVSIEVAERDLRRFGLTFDHVAAAIRNSSFDLPAGSVRTAGGELLVRSEGQAYSRQEFEKLILLTRPDGTRLSLEDVATVVDGFAESTHETRFDGDPAILVQVFRVGNQHDTVISQQVKDYIARAQPTLPEGIRLAVWKDTTRLLRGRIDTLLENGRTGLVLVLLVLAVFLRLRLAFWVAVGIPASFLGTLWLMPTLGLSINQLSLFAFMIVLGIVVDDAIVIGENIHRHHERGHDPVGAAVAGVTEVAVPVVFSVLTTVVAFVPLTTVPGTPGKVIRVLPLVAIITLMFSLLESLLILPSHLTHVPAAEPGRKTSGRRRLRDRFNAFFDRFVEQHYSGFVRRVLAWRYTSVATALAVLLLSLGWVAGGHIGYSFYPPVEAENVAAVLRMPVGTPPEMTAEAARRLEMSAAELERQIADEGEPGVIRNTLTTIGYQPSRGVGPGARSSHLCEVNIELSPAESRRLTATRLMHRWRDLTGPIPEASELTFDSAFFLAGAPVDIQLGGQDLKDLRRAADELKLALSRYSGVYNTADSFQIGKQVVSLTITPEAEALELTLSDLARQVRQAFYGEEVQRIQRGADDVKVMLRYPPDERRSLANLEGMHIRTPAGDQVPFAVAGRLELGRGLASIVRTDRRRTVHVTADVDPEHGDGNVILADLERRVLPDLLARYPGLTFSFEGARKEQNEASEGLRRSFTLALFVIYALLAIPLRSYLQPLLVMAAIPFGIIGAVFGHVIMARGLTVFSLFGIMALTGVVVNDSLVLVDFINRLRNTGASVTDAVRKACASRFRPVVMTSLTTFAGLMPLLFETSQQAQNLIPMAISIAFGVLFAAAISLLLVPVGYLMLQDLQSGIAHLARRAGLRS